MAIDFDNPSQIYQYSINMYNEDGKLIVIHEYPTPSLNPFLNPVCKDTYSALPKIYGRHGKRYMSGPHSTKLTKSSRYLRECCEQKYQKDHRSHSDIKTTRKQKAKPMPASNKIVTFKPTQKKIRPRKLTPHMPDIALPSLKGFSAGELSEVESQHKVYKSRGVSSLEVQFKSDSKGNIRQTIVNDIRGSHVTIQFGNSDESVQTDERFFALADIKNYKITKTDNPRSDYRQFYEYLQNGQNNEEKDQQELKLAKKQSHSSQDETFSITSSKLKRKKDSTMFHRFKKKFEGIPRQRSSSQQRNANSVLSNGLFQIPEEEEYGDYLMKYKLIDSNFDIRSLVKQADFHIVADEGRVYFGQIRNNKRHGMGITVSEKEIYEGRYEKDIKVEGCQKNRDGIYIGDYLDGKRHGKGKFAWYNGQTFDGEWKGGKKNGYGKWKSPKGDYYEGQWVDNRQNGEGYHYHIGGSKYRGQFKNFLKHGQGQQQFPNGDVYVGQYVKGKPHGQGKYTWSNGDSYDGQFEEGSRSGFGILKQKSGYQYEGEFRNDEKHGEGRQLNSKTGEQFQGQFRFGDRHKGSLKTREGKVTYITN